MTLFLYNTKSQKKEIFTPENNNLVKIYVCGPTVYDNPHIGNARSAVIYDLLYRILIHIFGKESVKYVRNITDIDDKIIDRAKDLGVKISDLTSKTIIDYHKDMDYLNCLRPNIEPKATDHVDDMIMIIQKLLDNNHAYIMADHVYFKVKSYNHYNDLSRRTSEEMMFGTRIEADNNKLDKADFVLWKPAAEDDDIGANFDSPWGIGRPGWHIECSAMSHKYLGENFDIHGGGADLIFPHHTNEIAQSICAFPNSKFANYWIHNGFLTVNGEKMSKSLGNFMLVKDMMHKKIIGDVVRLFFISTHYRKPLDFNNKSLKDAQKIMDYWYRAIKDLDIDIENLSSAPEEFIAILLNDMNTSLAIKKINDYAKEITITKDHESKILKAKKLLSSANFLGLMKIPIRNWFQNEDFDVQRIEEMIALRQNAKEEKNWVLADKIRNQLFEQGIILEDSANNITNWRKA